jgi:hypothetical protein
VDSFDTRTPTVEEPRSRRPLSSRLADLGDRIARALPPPRRGPEYTFPAGGPTASHNEGPYDGAEDGPDDGSYDGAYEPDPHATEEFRVRRLEREPVDDILPRFPVTRQGYDCNAVDIHIAELEEELNELERQLGEARAQVPSRDAVAIEIERVGEQTSAILVAAHDEAQQTIRLARTHADTVIADATSYAAALTDEATRKVSALEDQAAALDREHERRLAELRSTAAALQSLAENAANRFTPTG